jgi:cytoskeletal protein RodZ
MGELGELLRKAREAKGLSLAQVEEATKIRSAYLQALEEENYERLPPPTYVKGFLKNYARYLELDPPQVLALYAGPATTELAAPVPVMLNEPLLPLGLRKLRLLGVALLIIALASAGWWAYAHYYGGTLPALPFASSTATPTLTRIPPSPTPLPSTATPTLTSTTTPTPTPIIGVVVSIEIVGQRSWVRVEVDGQEAFAGTLEPGSANIWTGRERIVLRVGNAGAVRVTVNGQVLGFVGQSGQVLEKEWTAPGVPTRTPKPSPTKAP